MKLFKKRPKTPTSPKVEGKEFRPYMVFDLADFGEIWVDEDGYCAFNGKYHPVPAGKYKINGGKCLTIYANGCITPARPEPEAERTCFIRQGDPFPFRGCLDSLLSTEIL
jgi:hypothetical protein